ncbi:hypothetical protein Pd630_LPD01725 [Rhodococcus opacus PD630]|nr:hypothetical protein Pd630_LPD01725 [Rhodococcus opacus PD630]EJI96063.1 hypothetical protein JVH1_6518 [Rhodococcus sp. JVH1]
MRASACRRCSLHFKRDPIRARPGRDPHVSVPAAGNARAPRCCQVGGQAATRG